MFFEEKKKKMETSLLKELVLPARQRSGKPPREPFR